MNEFDVLLPRRPVFMSYVLSFIYAGIIRAGSSMQVTHQCTPTSRFPMRSKNTVLMFATALLIGCSTGVPVTITNQSGRAIQNVAISGAGFDQRISSIPAGESITLYVHPRGKTGIAVGFDLTARRFSYPENGYFEASGYKVAIVVDAAGRAAVHAELARY